MGANTHIQWTDYTFNPWEGCTKVSPGCAHCYAEARDIRFTGGQHWGKGAPRRRTSVHNWNEPRRWDSQPRMDFERRQRVFCASLADWLDDEVPIEWTADLLDLIRATPNLDWQLLTKRPENWRPRLDQVYNWTTQRVYDYNPALQLWVLSWLQGQAPDNVWIGTTVEDQARADERIPLLLRLPAKVRFLSCEPLLGPVDLIKWLHPEGRCGECLQLIEVHRTCVSCDCCCEGPEGTLTRGDLIDWIICGGESGKDARPMHPAWARSLRDQCAAAGVPFFFKQWGEWAEHNDTPATVQRNSWGMFKVGKIPAGRRLDGIEHNAFPS